MTFLIILLLYPVVGVIVLCYLNARAMLPGTTNYRLVQDTEKARTQAIIANYRNKEDEHHMKQLERTTG